MGAMPPRFEISPKIIVLRHMSQPVGWGRKRLAQRICGEMIGFCGEAMAARGSQPDVALKTRNCPAEPVQIRRFGKSVVAVFGQGQFNVAAF